MLLIYEGRKRGRTAFRAFKAFFYFNRWGREMEFMMERSRAWRIYFYIFFKSLKKICGIFEGEMEF